MRGRNALRLAVSASLLSAAGLAPAQEVKVDRLEEIIVTAQKREERLRDVPQSITAISDVTLNGCKPTISQIMSHACRE